MKTRRFAPFFTLVLFSGTLLIPSTFGDEGKKAPKAAKAPEADLPIITDKNVVAIVNGQKITKQDLYDLMVDTYGEDALDVLIRRTLIYQTAKKDGVSVPASEVEQKLKTLVNGEIDALMRRYGIKERAELEKELVKVDSSVAKLEDKLSRKMRKQAEIELLAEKTLEKTITITEEDLQKAYEQEYGEKIEASQVVYKTRREAEDSLKKLKSGADFAAVAKSDSIDRASAARGGKMQPFSPKDGIGSQVAHLKVGDISDILKTEHGFHILKITGRTAASNKTLKSVRGDLEKIVRNQRYKERLGSWLVSLIEGASITKNLASE